MNVSVFGQHEPGMRGSVTVQQVWMGTVKQ